MATKSKTVEEYVERRVRELIAADWDDTRIIQQLEACGGKKLVIEVLAATRK
jgi:hypothetical protein